MNVHFPNMFMVVGPNSPFSNLPPAIELQIDMAIDLVQQTLSRHAAAVEPKKSAEVMWVDACQELTDATILPKAKSWIFGANIPGKPFTLTFYMGGYSKYKTVLQDIRAGGFEQFSFHA